MSSCPIKGSSEGSTEASNSHCCGQIIKKIFGLYCCASIMLNKLQPLALLGIRIWVAVIFFKSGLVKFADMENTKMLFEYEYQVPVLPIWFAAYSATFFELVMPILLVLGLFTRAAALPLLVMTAVIQFTYQDHMQHYYWAMMIGIILTFGAGCLSLDKMMSRKCHKKSSCSSESEEKASCDS